MAFIGPYQQYTIDGEETVARIEDWEQSATAANAGMALAESNAVASAETYTDGQVATDRGRLTLIESKNTTQDGRLSAVESENTAQDVRISSVESAAFVGGGLLMEDPADPGFYIVGPP